MLLQKLWLLPQKRTKLVSKLAIVLQTLPRNSPIQGLPHYGLISGLTNYKLYLFGHYQIAALEQLTLLMTPQCTVGFTHSVIKVV